MINQESQLSQQSVLNSFEAPWMFEHKSTPQLRITLHHVKDGLKFWKQNPHQNQQVSTAIAQHQHAVSVVAHYLKLSKAKD